MGEVSAGNKQLMSEIPTGFSFENYQRNAMMDVYAARQEELKASMGIVGGVENKRAETTTANSSAATTKMLAKKTGTTICGIVTKDAVVLGADTRATGGETIVEKDCEKIHKIADNIWCCGAGTAADTEYTTELTRSQLEILRMETHALNSPLDLRVVAALTRLKRMLFRYQGYISAALILGGVDNVQGPQLYSIHPHGSTGRFTYIAMGSGSLAAMSILENGWRPDMSEADGVTLVKRAIAAGIFNDLGSGSTISINVIRTDGTVDDTRRCETPNDLAPYRNAIRHSSRFTIPNGTTPVLKSSFTPHSNAATLADVTVTEGDEMEE